MKWVIVDTHDEVNTAEMVYNSKAKIKTYSCKWCADERKSMKFWKRTEYIKQK